MKNINITKFLHLIILIIALVLGMLGKYEVAIWILLMGIYAEKIDGK